MIGIYKFTNKYNRKVYVGQSTNIEKRRKFHKYYVYTRNSPFYLDVRKYGFEGFDFDVLIECPKENLNYWEEFYIKYYSSNNSNFGYNISKGGRGARGVTWSREVIDKRANKMKEKWSDEDYYNMMKVKMSVPHPKRKEETFGIKD